MNTALQAIQDAHLCMSEVMYEQAHIECIGSEVATMGVSDYIET